MQVEDMARLTLQNILLMGFDPWEALARHDVQIDEQVLLAPSGVQRQMEVLMHFVVIKAFPDVDKAMKLVWPIVEKTQARDFRRLVTDKLIALQRDKEMQATPAVRSTTMDSPCGPKFLAILFHASQAAMRRSLSHMKQPLPPSLPPFLSLSSAGGGVNQQLAASQLRMLLLHTSRERRRLLGRIAEVVSAHREWQGFAERAMERYEEAVREREVVRLEMEEMMGEAGCGAAVLSAAAAEARRALADAGVGRKWERVQRHLDGVSPEGVAAADEIVLHEGERPSIDVERLKGGSREALGDRAELEALLQGWAASTSQLNAKLAQGGDALVRLGRDEHDAQVGFPHHYPSSSLLA